MAETRASAPSTPSRTGVETLISWLDASPTPFHVVDSAAAVLGGAGFTEWTPDPEELPGTGYIATDGALIAWRLGDPHGGFRIVGAHTDSPNLRIQPHADLGVHGWSQLGIEVYGGVLLNSWLDRDLGLAGRVVDSHGRVRLFSVDEPLARVPQLAIHLDRNVTDGGLVLDKQSHMMPVWGTTNGTFHEWLAAASGVTDIVAYDAHLFDITPARLIGRDRTLLASGRLDNQLSCWAATHALATSEAAAATQIVVLNDHEEVGSESSTGAAGPLLERIIGMVLHRHGTTPSRLHDVMSRSWCLSADNAHAIHPNYPERHEPRHAPRPNHGPALKMNGNQRYATSARGLAHARSLAERRSIPLQTFVSRNNMPCGSTIGPITATRLGIETIDIGVPQLSMHSARELCGAEDPGHLLGFARAFLSE